MTKPSPAPEAPPRRRGLRIFVGVATLFFVAALACLGYAYFAFERFADAPLRVPSDAATLEIPLGTPLPGVVRLLDAQGFNPGSAVYWRVLARQLGVSGQLHAGEYALDAALSPRGLLRKMASGEVIQHHFTIVEGWNIIQLRAALAQDSALQQVLPQLDDAQLMQRLGDPDVLPEGEFLPETYSFVKGMSDLDILRRAHEALHKMLGRLWSERDPQTPLKSSYDALILASIVEKETGRSEERPQIARVFLHRLQLNMKLQTDPTVIYGLGTAYTGNLHRRDLETDTPFNTYTRFGLPPTPIAMPGKAALDAVIHPTSTDALYFVARGDGAHEFSSTLDAHNHAVAKYQLNRIQTNK